MIRRHNRQRWILVAILCLIPFSALCEESPFGGMEQKVLTALSGFEHVAGTDFWASLGTESLPVLKRIVEDAGRTPLHRSRAILALAAFPTDETHAFLSSLLLREDPMKDLIQRHALRALAVGFKERALADIVPFLEHEDFFIRESAAKALGTVGTPQAMDILRKLLDRRRAMKTGEKDTVFLETLEKLTAARPKKAPKP